MGLGGFLIKQYGASEYKRGKADAVAQQNAAVVQQGKKQNEIEYELRTLDDDDLIRRYCRWVYDMPYDECIRSYRFVKQD
jgi:cell division protein FtsB